jgi:8-oxo-dGTP diphosphatase
MPKTDQDVQSKRYKVVPRTLIFIFDNQGRALLLKGSSNKRLWAGLLNGIGGHIECGEDIQESALRELEEETGIVGLPLSYCGQIMVNVEEELGVAIFIFRGDYNGDHVRESSEGRLIWVALDSLDNKIVMEDLPALLPRVYQFRPGDPLIIGKFNYDTAGNLKTLFR